MVLQTFDGVERGLRRWRIDGPWWEIFESVKKLMRRYGRGGEVIGRGVVLGVFKSSLWENYGGAIGVFREESSEVDGGAVW
ncbi:hypothetical protein Tco_1303667 [Tanacetum coccineum]